MKKLKIFVNNNLDGAGSLLCLKWALWGSNELDITECNIFEFPDIYRNFIRSNLIEYDKVFVLNLFNSNIIEAGTVIFCKSKDTETTTDICYSAFASKLDKGLLPSQRKLISDISEFYLKNTSSTWKLLAILDYLDNSVIKFASIFDNGITINAKLEPIIAEFKNRMQRTVSTMSVYKDKGDRGLYIGLVDDIRANPVIFEIVFRLHRPSIFFMVNLETKDVVIKKDSNSSVNLDRFCGSLIDGVSFCNTAGGKILPKFIDFTKEFIPC